MYDWFVSLDLQFFKNCMKKGNIMHLYNYVHVRINESIVSAHFVRKLLQVHRLVSLNYFLVTSSHILCMKSAASEVILTCAISSSVIHVMWTLPLSVICCSELVRNCMLGGT